MNVETISVGIINARPGSRNTTIEAVSALAASIAAIGLLQPITVRNKKVMDGPKMVDEYEVVAGRHRLAAVVSLGWESIPAFVIEADDYLTAELIEIDENLCRAELTAAQRSVAVKRRAEIWTALHPDSAESNNGKSVPTIPDRGRGRPKEFASETAEASGMTKRSINQHLARAEALGDDLAEVTGTSLDKGVELDALAKLDAPERHALIERAKAGEQVTARGRDEEEANVRRVKQMLAELERCAKYMDEAEFAAIVADMDVSGTARRLASVIAKASLRKVA